MPAERTFVKPSDRRTHPRFEERSRVTVTVLSAPDVPHIESRSYYCWTRDLSAEGMRFCVHSRVPMGSILKLEVMFDDPREVFRHIGKVMWAQEFNDDGVISNWLGVQITETLGGDARCGIWKVCIESKPPAAC
jgi:hypothetical protein